jgi:hypothetical protein
LLSVSKTIPNDQTTTQINHHRFYRALRIFTRTKLNKMRLRLLSREMSKEQTEEVNNNSGHLYKFTLTCRSHRQPTTKATSRCRLPNAPTHTDRAFMKNVFRVILGFYNFCSRFLRLSQKYPPESERHSHSGGVENLHSSRTNNKRERCGGKTTIKS